MEKRNNTEEHKMNISPVANQISLNKRPVRRPRSLTTLRLEVVAERARKLKRIKEGLEMGTYKANTNLVAKSLLERFDVDDLE